MNAQAPSSVILIRPHRFSPNPQTASDNAFQSPAAHRDAELVAAAAHAEVTALAAALAAEGITVHLFEDSEAGRPDSVFPNNWLSTHAGGHVALFPMYAPNRRSERRGDIVELLKSCYRVQDVIDYSGLELDEVFLEGTGAMVLDHVGRVAYTAKSRRADPVALERFCTNFGYEPMAFDAADAQGTAIYHTNVMMAIATNFALVGLELISSPARRQEVVDRLTGTGREVIELTGEQVAKFAGNAIELRGATGRLLVLSHTAFDALSAEQKQRIERSCRLLPVHVPTIELAGGSVRCMIAGIHLDRRPAQVAGSSDAPQQQQQPVLAAS